MAKERIFVGLWSGWAADGVDAAAVAISGRGRRMKLRELHHSHHPFGKALAARVRAAAGGAALSAGRLAALDAEVAGAFAASAAAAISQAAIPPDEIVAIGSSGQMVARGRAVAPSVMVLGEPAAIAEATGACVVAGFAASDLAAGGAGGPVTAWPDWLVFRDRRLSRVVLHLGGVVSLTFVPAAAQIGDVLAFDVAPGGVVLDALARRLFDRPCDADGAIAAKGRVCPELLGDLSGAAFFRARPRRLASGDEWSGAYLDRLTMLAAKDRCVEADIIPTFTELIARAVAEAVSGLTERPHEVVLTGGAGLNIHLAGRIRALLSPCSTYAVDRYGHGLRAYNAACVAVLAAARIDRRLAHCPSATGANRQAVLGAIWRP